MHSSIKRIVDQYQHMMLVERMYHENIESIKRDYEQREVYITRQYIEDSVQIQKRVHTRDLLEVFKRDYEQRRECNKREQKEVLKRLKKYNRIGWQNIHKSKEQYQKLKILLLCTKKKDCLFSTLPKELLGEICLFL